MTKRVYGDNGRWSKDAADGINIIRHKLAECFDDLESAGWNSREAGLLIKDETDDIATIRVLDCTK